MAVSLSTPSSAIPLTHAPDGIGYRLIELPPDLQAVLESDSPPVLSLISTPTTTAALLKTPTKTYSLRQKNTSNILTLLTPTPPDTCARTHAAQGHGEAPETGAGMGQGGLGIVGTVQETVELVPETKEPPAVISKAKNTGSQGKWHERFGRNR